MLYSALTLAALAVQYVHAQSPTITYTGCRYETVSGSVLYGCVNPAGTRTILSTLPVTSAASTSATTTAAAEAQTTAVTGCHTHSGETGVYCTNGAGTEVVVQATPTGEAPATYSGCHEHGPDEL